MKVKFFTQILLDLATWIMCREIWKIFLNFDGFWLLKISKKHLINSFLAIWTQPKTKEQKAAFNGSHFASFWPANFVKLPRELREAPPPLLAIIIGARDHWQRTTSWSSSIGARDHRRSSWSLTERKTVKSRWWCHEIGAHFSLFFFGFWFVDFSSRVLRVFRQFLSRQFLHVLCEFRSRLVARFRHMFCFVCQGSWVSVSFF